MRGASFKTLSDVGVLNKVYLTIYGSRDPATPELRIIIEVRSLVKEDQIKGYKPPFALLKQFRDRCLVSKIIAFKESTFDSIILFLKNPELLKWKSGPIALMSGRT
jgi:hypothetical protein